MSSASRSVASSAAWRPRSDTNIELSSETAHRNSHLIPNPHRLLVPVVLIWVIAGASVLPALAAPGQITGLSGSPFPGQVHNPVNVKVDGNGSCTFSLNFGDGSAPVRRTGPLSFQQTHTYARSGTYWLHAKAISGCSGQANRQSRFNSVRWISTIWRQSPISRNLQRSSDRAGPPLSGDRN